MRAQGGLVDLTPERGDIVDREGHALARTIDAWIVGLQPGKVIGNKLDLARKLAELMPEKDEAAYLQMLRSGRSFYYSLRRPARAWLPRSMRWASRAWRCSASPTGSTRS